MIGTRSPKHPRAVVDGPISPTLVEPFFEKGGRVHLISNRVKVGKKNRISSVGEASLVFPPGVSCIDYNL